ncbi:MAG: DUF1194 domain-containing protein [Geminicoccaceae bacterium]
MQGKLFATVAGLTWISLAGIAEAIPVDLELSLVIDSSGSISDSEFDQQVSGYAAAFRQAPVVESIVNSPNGIAVNTVFFATRAAEVTPFTLLQSEADVANFANSLDGINRGLDIIRGIGGSTNIPAGINLAAARLRDNNFESGNVIIDVSGDGPSNAGSTQAARNAALDSGVTRINGLAIGSVGIFDFYQANVIGGPNAFVERAPDFGAFAAAIANKVRVEVGAPPAAPIGVPEPGAIGLLGLGFLVLGFAMRRRNMS